MREDMATNQQRGDCLETPGQLTQAVYICASYQAKSNRFIVAHEAKERSVTFHFLFSLERIVRRAPNVFPRQVE